MRTEIQNTDKGKVIDVITTEQKKVRYTKEFLDKQIQAMNESILKLETRRDEFMELRSQI